MTARLPLFAYGTLMFPEIIAEVIGRAPRAKAVRGYNCERREVRGQNFPGLIRASAKDAVSGVLYDDLTDSEWTLLDAYEGNLYELGEILVECEGTPSQALAYIIREANASLLGSGSWDPDVFRQRHLPSYLAE